MSGILLYIVLCNIDISSTDADIQEEMSSQFSRQISLLASVTQHLSWAERGTLYKRTNLIQNISHFQTEVAAGKRKKNTNHEESEEEMIAPIVPSECLFISLSLNNFYLFIHTHNLMHSGIYSSIHLILHLFICSPIYLFTWSFILSHIPTCISCNNQNAKMLTITVNVNQQ